MKVRLGDVLRECRRRGISFATKKQIEDLKKRNNELQMKYATEAYWKEELGQCYKYLSEMERIQTNRWKRENFDKYFPNEYKKALQIVKRSNEMLKELTRIF